MLNLQTEFPTSRWQPGNRAASSRSEPARWSSFDDVVELLRFDGALRRTDDTGLYSRRRYKAGAIALRMDQPFDALHVVRFGSLKTSVTLVDGGEHVLNFPMKGDLLGLDGICEQRYHSETVALTDCELIRLPATELFSAGHGGGDLERITCWAISRNLVRDHVGYSLSHAARSETRVARFLLAQSKRFADMGYSPVCFTLPMTRRDIGNHLDVTLETVSRAFSALDHEGIISVRLRTIEILSMHRLRAFER